MRKLISDRTNQKISKETKKETVLLIGKLINAIKPQGRILKPRFRIITAKQSHPYK